MTAALLFTVCLMASSAFAVSLPPPNPVYGYRYMNADPGIINLPTGSFITQMDSPVTTFDFVNQISHPAGTLHQQVYREADSGTLDFIYTLSPSTAPDAATSLYGIRVPWVDPSLAVVDAGYLDHAGVCPGLVARFYDNSPVDFYFDSLADPVSGTLLPNYENGTATLVIRTTATAYAASNALIIATTDANYNFAFDNNVMALVPNTGFGASAPEPASLVLFAGGVMAFILRRR
jgi:hypothetical protein